MSWLGRIFGQDKPENPQAAIDAPNVFETPEGEEAIPPERVGLNGEYDQSGLAKRVVLAFDEDSELDDEEKLWVAQTGSTVVLKGTVSCQEALDKMVSVAQGVNGSTSCNTEQVTIE